MGRPRKVREEGALSRLPVPPVEEVARDHDGNEIAFPSLSDIRGVVDDALNEVLRPAMVDMDEPKHLAKDFNAAIAYFKECFPEDWAELERCPLMHGVEIIAHKLAGKA